MEFHHKEDMDNGKGRVVPFIKIESIKTCLYEERVSHDVINYQKESHKEKVEDVEEQYDLLVKQEFHIGIFQSIAPLWISDDGKSTFGQLFLPASWEHAHDSLSC